MLPPVLVPRTSEFVPGHSMLPGRGGPIPPTHAPQMPPNQNFTPTGFPPLFATGPGQHAGQSATFHPPIPGSPTSPGVFPHHWSPGIPPQHGPTSPRLPASPMGVPPKMPDLSPQSPSESRERHPSPARSPPATKTEQNIQCECLFIDGLSKILILVPISPFPAQNSPVPKYENPQTPTSNASTPPPLIMPRFAS